MWLMQAQDPKNSLVNFLPSKRYTFVLQLTPASNVPIWKNISEGN